VSSQTIVSRRKWICEYRIYFYSCILEAKLVDYFFTRKHVSIQLLTYHKNKPVDLLFELTSSNNVSCCCDRGVYCRFIGYNR